MGPPQNHSKIWLSTFVVRIPATRNRMFRLLDEWEAPVPTRGKPSQSSTLKPTALPSMSM